MHVRPAAIQVRLPDRFVRTRDVVVRPRARERVVRRLRTSPGRRIRRLHPVLVLVLPLRGLHVHAGRGGQLWRRHVLLSRARRVRVLPGGSENIQHQPAGHLQRVRGAHLHGRGAVHPRAYEGSLGGGRRGDGVRAESRGVWLRGRGPGGLPGNDIDDRGRARVPGMGRRELLQRRLPSRRRSDVESLPRPGRRAAVVLHDRPGRDVGLLPGARLSDGGQDADADHVASDKVGQRPHDAQAVDKRRPQDAKADGFAHEEAELVANDVAHKIAHNPAHPPTNDQTHARLRRLQPRQRLLWRRCQNIRRGQG
mmetsp:Transcript_25330/g.60884  ORF Transcript_25330/g.60884 Transcript_25330/m.60884 type:complete len:310 (-) Transcript_25330:1150-2079(-)